MKSLSTKLAKMSAKERKELTAAFTYLCKNCPMGSRMGTTMKTLDELYVGAVQNLKKAHASNKLGATEKASVEKAIALLQKAHGLNKDTMGSFALLVGAPAKKSDCATEDCGKGGCDSEKSSCDKEGCDKEGKSDCGDCVGGCGEKAVATSNCAPSIAYAKRLCSSWAKAAKEVTKIDPATAQKMQVAFKRVEPLGLLQNSMQSLKAQTQLVRSAVKAMPCSSKVGCPSVASLCDNGGSAVGSVYALLSALPMNKKSAKSGCGEAKSGCSESKTECSESKTECSSSKKSCGSKVRQ